MNTYPSGNYVMGTISFINSGDQLPCGGTALYPGQYSDCVTIPAPDKYHKCEYCGRRNNHDAELCKSCGAPIEKG